ncbi:hypothetical protein [Hymenobacter swuensis]|uniref:Uncharacterized protein n=1 Tax=Hymenobacter swuensis DY53 TaxID=1227739 RepID=W8F4L0_9BACT|nr:hypothetical protein [Hymenobacter swuensis]AHJ98932.1 hypothetical protein Hsw_3337 [Hymenobacter swuensis DY53]
MPLLNDIQPLINGVSYSWADIQAQILGKTIYGISAISYEDTQNMEDNYGAGMMPTSRGYGKYEAKASITIEAKESERLVEAVPSGRLQDIPPFPITVAYVNPANRTVSHKLMNCQFKGNKRDVKSGDTKIEVEHELIISHIQWK